MSAATGKAVFGKSVARLEDPDLLRGKGRYVDDIHLPGMLEAAFVRSPFAHAAINGINTEAARALPGVHAVYTLSDLLPHLRTERLLVAMPSPAIDPQQARLSVRLIMQTALGPPSIAFAVSSTPPSCGVTGVWVVKVVVRFMS